MTPATSRRKATCEVCKDVESKYVCPRCKLASCSLECFKKHKELHKCNGKSEISSGTRDEYINKKDIEEHDVQRDYNFLLRVNRTLEVSKRKVGGEETHKKRGRIGGEINMQGVRVRKMPFGMERNRINKSGKKGKSFYWSVEWVLMDDEEKVLEKYIRYKALESEILRDLIPSQWIKGPFTLMIKDIERNVYVKMDAEERLCDALRGKLVIEFPSIIVKLGEGCDDDESPEECSSKDPQSAISS